MKRIAAVGIAAAFIFISACSSDSSSSAPQKSGDETSASSAEPTRPSEQVVKETSEPELEPEVVTYADVVSGSFTTAAICARYTDLIDRYSSVVAKRTKSLKGKSEDPYKAAKFVDNNAWANEDLAVDFDKDWKSASTDALNEVSNGQAGSVDSIDDYLQASLDACGLDADYSSLASKVGVVDRNQASVVSAANNKPWYPKGYAAVRDGVAVKWVDGSDPCGRGPLCWYWHLSVVSEDGCPRGLYVETNLLDSGGTVISWTNASVPSLRPGQKAKLPLYTYNRTVDGIELAEVSCR